MKKYTNFQYQKSQEILKEGILIVDDVNNMPTYNEPYISSNYVIIINNLGSVDTEYDGNIRHFSHHDISMIYPGHILFPHKSSADYKATSIVVSSELFGKLGVHKIYQNRFSYEINPDYHLSDNQYEDVMNVVTAMKSVSHLNNISKQEMLISMLYVLIQMVNTFRQGSDAFKDSIQTPLSTRLYEMLNQHSREHHDVQYYADLFHLTPKHFSTVIKKETGYNVSHWIRLYIIAESKMILRKEANLSLQEISEIMGFHDIASFSRFFKRETGLTPSDFRKK